MAASLELLRTYPLNTRFNIWLRGNYAYGIRLLLDQLKIGYELSDGIGKSSLVRLTLPTPESIPIPYPELKILLQLDEGVAPKSAINAQLICLEMDQVNSTEIDYHAYPTYVMLFVGWRDSMRRSPVSAEVLRARIESTRAEAIEQGAQAVWLCRSDEPIKVETSFTRMIQNLFDRRVSALNGFYQRKLQEQARD